MKSYLLTAVIGSMSLFFISFSATAEESEILTHKQGQTNPFNLEYPSICDVNPQLPSCS
jgi:hypothetical protein